MIPCNLKKTHVIVVNDDKTQIRVLSGLLQKEGIVVQAFNNAADALIAMNQNPLPDLIITDLYMPDIDGWRFCRLLRSPEYQHLNQTPILVISATFSGNDIADISADIGANGFLPAPVDGKQFLEQVQTLLKGERPRLYLHVLIVEDSLTLSGMLARAFQSHGYLVKTAQTYIEAMDSFKKTAFDVAIIDYHLPDGQGDGLLHTFRTVRPDCDCIMMTTDPDTNLALSWMKQGAAAYLHKPFKPEYLIELCVKARRERSLLRVEALLDLRTQELRRSEERFRTIVRNAFDMVSLLDTNGRCLYCNSAYTEILGYSPEELAGRSYFEIVHPEERQQAQQCFLENLATHVSSAKTQLRLVHRQGQCLHVDHQARFISDSSNTPMILLNARDITGQKQAENLLRQKSNERRLLLDTIPTQIWYLTDIDTYGAINQAHADFLGRSPKTIAYKKLDEILSADVAAVSRGSNLRVFKTGRSVITEEWMTHSSGERRLIHITKTPKLDDAGRVEFVVCAGNDITELHSLERQFRGIFEKAPIAIEIYDADGRLQTANPKCIELFGIAEEKEIVGFNLFDDPNITEEIKSKLQRGETVYYESPFDFEKVRSAGLYQTTRSGSIHLAVTITLLKPKDSLDLSGYLVIIQDITQKKQYETDRLSYEHKLQQLQKAESLGRMAGAVAHNFNNLLQAVIGNLDLAMEELPHDSKHLVAAQIAAEKAAGVSSMMLAYRGQLPGKLALLDISEVCRQSLPLLQAGAPNDIVIAATIPDSGPMIRASAGQIHQALANLIANACEAAGETPNTVILTVKTVSQSQIPASRRFPVDWIPRDVDHACIEVVDTGSGISDNNLEKVFDPFFSTRFYGRGMGLSVVLGIVGAHAGGIVVKSEPNRGSIFQVFLPISSETIPLHSTKTIPAPQFEASGMVLLIEDEEPVRNLAAIMLARLGFTVLEATNGVEAIEIFQKHMDEIRCIFSDLTMPELDGWELLSALRKLSPHIPVILSSGYDEANVMSHEHSEQPDVFLGKPYRFQELRNAVYQALLNR